MISEEGQMCYNLKYLTCLALAAAVVTAITADGRNHGYCQQLSEVRNKSFYTYNVENFLNW